MNIITTTVIDVQFAVRFRWAVQFKWSCWSFITHYSEALYTVSYVQGHLLWIFVMML